MEALPLPASHATPLHASTVVAAVAARRTARPPAKPPAARIVVPVRYSAWLAGDMGRALERTLEVSLAHLVGLRVTRMPRALLVEAEEAPGVLLEAVQRGMHDLERSVQAAYPVFHHQFGPVWTGTLQAVFT